MKTNKLLYAICGGVTLLCVLLLLVSALRGGNNEAEAAAEASASLPAADRAYFESPEYAAAAAWDSFRTGFDSDGSVFNAFLTGSVELDKKYELYPVYSQEMADELERIRSQYGLSLHEEIGYFYSADELYTAANTGSFIRQGSSCTGYLYTDGSFHFDGSAYLSGSLAVDYRFDRQVRGIFSEETLTLGSGEGWTIESESGTLLYLSLGENECVIHAALPNSFVSITALKGAATTENPSGFSAAGLEELAACFDWSAIN